MRDIWSWHLPDRHVGFGHVSRSYWLTVIDPSYGHPCKYNPAHGAGSRGGRRPEQARRASTCVPEHERSTFENRESASTLRMCLWSSSSLHYVFGGPWSWHTLWMALCLVEYPYFCFSSKTNVWEPFYCVWLYHICSINKLHHRSAMSLHEALSLASCTFFCIDRYRSTVMGAHRAQGISRGFSLG